MSSFIDYLKDNNEIFVDSILRGYRDYIDIRIEKSEELLVSGGYAWVKANHIEHSLGKELKSDQRFKIEVSKAGYSWEYLKFTDIETNCIMMIRETSNLEKISGNNNCPEYLSKYIKLNGIINVNGNNIQQGTLWDFPINNDEEYEKEYLVSDDKKAFYFLTYSINKITRDIDKLELVQPIENMNHGLFFKSIMNFEISNSNMYLLDNDKRDKISEFDNDNVGQQAINYQFSSDLYNIDVIENDTKKSS